VAAAESKRQGEQGDSGEDESAGIEPVVGLGVA
jgi:hypothetical protein